MLVSAVTLVMVQVFYFQSRHCSDSMGCFVFETEHLNVSKGEFMTKELLWDEVYKECDCECPR